MLDGLNEIPHSVRDDFLLELSHIQRHWQNVRLLITGRVLTNDHVFDSMETAELIGIPCAVRDIILQEADDVPADPCTLQLLRSPLFLQIFLKSQDARFPLTSRGEILDAYFHHICPDDSELLAFVVHFALPITVGWLIGHGENVVPRGEITEAVDIASALYLDRERVYQNMLVPRHFRRDSLKKQIQETDIPALLTEHFGFLEAGDSGHLQFTHQYFRDYFAARHYVNLMEIFSKSFDGRHLSDVQEIFDQFRMGSVWFWNDDPTYELIGEICGDHHNNVVGHEPHYRRTLLDDFLDYCRGIDHFRTMENVFNIMTMTRKGVICNVDFSELYLPLSMPEGVFFSNDGADPCDFSGCCVLGLFDSCVKAELDSFEINLPPDGCPQYYLNCNFSDARICMFEETREILRRYCAIGLEDSVLVQLH